MEKRDLAGELLRLRARMERSPMDEDEKQREIMRFAGRNMDAPQKEKLQSILQDRQALQQLFQSEQAKTLLERLKKDQ